MLIYIFVLCCLPYLYCCVYLFVFLAQRDSLFDSIVENSSWLKYEVDVISPQEMSAKMLRR